MAFTAPSSRLNFENPYENYYSSAYKNPYSSEIPPVSDEVERCWSAMSTEHSQYAEKQEWDVEEAYARKEKDEHECAAKYDQAVKQQALPFQNITAPDATRTLSFHNLNWKRKDLIIKDEGGKTIYYADVSRLTSAPDIVLHTGETKHHPIAAIARFRYSRHLQLGLGDPANELAIVWEEMKNTKRLAHSRYRLEITNTEPDGSGERRAIVFQRTHAKEDGVLNRMCWMNFKIVDETTGELLAMHLATGWKTWTKRATLHIKSGSLAGNTEIWVVLGLCGLIEKNWRRDARNSN